MEVSNRVESAESLEIAPICPITGESPTEGWLGVDKDSFRRRLVAQEVGTNDAVAAISRSKTGKFIIFIRKFGFAAFFGFAASRSYGTSLST